MRTPRLIESITFLCLGVFLFSVHHVRAQPFSQSVICVRHCHRRFPDLPLSAIIRRLSAKSDARFFSELRYSLAGVSLSALLYTLLQCRGEYLSVPADLSIDAVGTPTSKVSIPSRWRPACCFSFLSVAELVRMCIGGGGGSVFSIKEVRRLAGIEAESQRIIPALDIHMLLSVEWFFYRNLSLQGEVLFRDPQISAENAFAQDHVRSNGIEYPLQKSPFRSTVNLNGNVYLLGLSLVFLSRPTFSPAQQFR
jgi:hypothetical protein